LRQEQLPGQTHASARTATTRDVAEYVLPGRARELAMLDAALERAANAGQPELLVVEGEAGIGKSRLLQTWAAAARATGVLALKARCDELERSLPLQPLADVLRLGNSTREA
jgi:predicted ATPase